MKKSLALLISTALLAACGETNIASEDIAPQQSETPQAPAAAEEAAPVETAEAEAPPVEALTLEARLAAADLENGRRQFLQCRSCHTLGEGERHLTGPNLWAVIGSPAGAREDYKYSDNLKNSGVVWDIAALYDFIERPNSYMPGSKMVFRGIADGKRRADLLAYLISETSPE